MGQKVNPTGFRIGHHRGLEEQVVRPQGGVRRVPRSRTSRSASCIDEKLNRQPPFAAVSDILIERTREEVTVTLKTARPGLVIGPKGAEVDKLREELEDLIKRKVAPIKVIEIKNPDLNAQLVAEAIAEQLKKRASFRRVLKMRHGSDDAGRRQGNQDPGERPAGRRGNRPPAKRPARARFR